MEYMYTGYIFRRVFNVFLKFMLHVVGLHDIFSERYVLKQNDDGRVARLARI